MLHNIVLEIKQEDFNLIEKLSQELFTPSSNETFTSYSFPSTLSDDFSNFELFPLPPPPSLEKFYSSNLNEAEIFRIPDSDDKIATITTTVWSLSTRSSIFIRCVSSEEIYITFYPDLFKSSTQHSIVKRKYHDFCLLAR